MSEMAGAEYVGEHGPDTLCMCDAFPTIHTYYDHSADAEYYDDEEF